MGCTNSSVGKSEVRHSGKELRTSPLDPLRQPAAFKRYHPTRCFEEDYELQDTILGSGLAGDIRLGTNRVTGARVAVKSLLTTGSSLDEMQFARAEAEIFFSADHPHIVTLQDVYISEERVDLVMECMEGGELFERVIAKERFSEPEAAQTLHQVLLALAYLHGKGVAHCDLKLDNCLYEENGGNHVKLCDFGFSQIVAPKRALTRQAGTLKYTSPDVLNGHYTSHCDLWSLGVMSFILLQGRFPFAGTDSQVRSKIFAGDWDSSPEKWGSNSSGARDFVRSLLVNNASVRLTAQQALSHPWLLQHQAPPSTLDRCIFNAMRSFTSATSLQRASRSAMAWSLNPSERATVRQAFLAMDRTNSGTLSLCEMREALIQAFHASDEEVVAIFEALNMSGNEVYYSEFLAAMCVSQIPLRNEHIKEVFACFDVTGSGRITLDCLEKLAIASPNCNILNECRTSLTHNDVITVEGFAAVLQGNSLPHKVSRRLPVLLLGNSDGKVVSNTEVGLPFLFQGDIASI